MDPKSCNRQPKCPVHALWSEVRDAMSDIFGRKTLAELARTIGQAYQVVGPPQVDISDVLFQLRD